VGDAQAEPVHVTVAHAPDGYVENVGSRVGRLATRFAGYLSASATRIADV
jgi:hypothetical protein